MKAMALAAMMVVLTMTLFTVEPIQAALSCNDVRSSLRPCSSYVSGIVTSPPGDCCDEVRSLNNGAREDRRAACKCVKELGSSLSGGMRDRAIQLPKSCYVNVDPNQDCDRL